MDENMTKMLSREVGTARKGEGCPRRHAAYVEKLVNGAVNGAKTLPQLVKKAAQKFGAQPALGTRRTVKTVEEFQEVRDQDGKISKKKFTIPLQTDYEWRTFEQVLDECTKFGAGIVQQASKTQKPLVFGQRIAIFCSTRAEWFIAANGAFQHGIQVATMYPSLGKEALAFSLKQTEVTHVVTEASQLESVVKVADQLPNLTTIVYMDEVKPENMAEYRKRTNENIEIVSYSEILNFGKDKKPPVKEPGPKDVAVIMYTSGSTGNPKGVLISHENIVSDGASVLANFPDPLCEKDSYIAFLPLAHILELTAENALFAVGTRIGYSSPQKLRDEQARDEEGRPSGDLRKLRPTLMASVPAVLDRMRTAVMDRVSKSGAIAQAIFNVSLYLKKRKFLQNQPTPLLDKLVFDKVAANFGGRLRYLLSGGAPLSPETQLFISVVFKAPISQGYGLTEVTGGATLSSPNDRVFGHVGVPLPCCEVKLVDVPDMGYLSTDKDEHGRPAPRGEVCVRGYNVSLGYFLLPDKTAEAFRATDDDPEMKWFYTGDIGTWLPNGALKIIDRKKDLVKLAHGEYIALGKIESNLVDSKLIDNICVAANSLLDRPVALVVVNHAEVIKLGSSSGTGTDVHQLVRSTLVKQQVLNDIGAIAKQHCLLKFEIPSDIYLVADAWTPDSGLVTDALKLKRHEIYKKYAQEIQAMYRH